MGWGAVMNDSLTGGRWSPSKAENHINCLELLAALFALKCFQSSLSGKHVKIMIDNTTAVSVINNIGKHVKVINVTHLELKFGNFVCHNIIWLTAAHIPRSFNYRTDKESRDFRSEDTEWMIDPTLLGIALDALNFKPQIDLFASRLNRQFPIYCSFKPYPNASYIDAFTLSWSD